MLGAVGGRASFPEAGLAAFGFRTRAEEIAPPAFPPGTNVIKLTTQIHNQALVHTWQESRGHGSAGPEVPTPNAFARCAPGCPHGAASGNRPAHLKITAAVWTADSGAEVEGVGGARRPNGVDHRY